MNKICNTCKIEKPITDFRKRLANKDKIKGWCILCETKYQRNKHLQRKECRDIRHF